MRTKSHSRFGAMLCIVLATTIQVPISLAGSIYSSHDFEAPDFTTGTLNMQNQWYVVSTAPPEDGIVTTDFSKYGKQSVYLKNTGNRVIARLAQSSGITTTHYVDAWIYPAHLQAVDNNVLLRFRDNSATIIGDVQFTTSSTITVNGDRQGIKYKLNEWNRVTVKLDLLNNLMNVYVNHELAYSDIPMTATPSGGIRYCDFE